MRLPFTFAFAGLLIACGGPAEPANAPVEPSIATPQPAPAPAKAEQKLDLSTKEKATATIYAALQRDDKAAFRKCVARARLARVDADNGFDAWYAVWKSAADKMPAFKSIGLVEEDGGWKLDEN
jgi:hypothetical protein